MRVDGSAGEPVPRVADPSRPTELVAFSRAIRTAASLCDIERPFRPWLEPLGEDVDLGELRAAGGDGAIGWVDEPARQARHVLRWKPGDGNLALIGSMGAGTTTALRSLLTTVTSTAGWGAHAYLIDARGDGGLGAPDVLSGIGGTVGLHDVERRARLIRLLADELDRRRSLSRPDGRQPIVLAIDGLSTLLSTLTSPSDLDEHGRLVHVITDGARAGIHTLATFERPGAVPASVLAGFAERWLFHLDDPAEGIALGIGAATVPPAIPGRIRVTGTRLEAQLAVLPIPEPTGRRGPTSAATPDVGTLGDDIDAIGLPASGFGDGSTVLVAGVDFDTLGPAGLEVPDGEHVLIAGPARSGRSTALTRLAAAWRIAHPDGLVVACCPRRGSALHGWVAARPTAAVIADDETAIAALVADAGTARRLLVAVDDAERVDDPAGVLLGIVNERQPNVTVVAAGRPDALRGLYGHWTTVVRRSRLGLVMTAGSEIDGDVFGEPLPRRTPIRPRAGLAWAFDGSGRRLVQVARDREAHLVPNDVRPARRDARSARHRAGSPRARSSG